MSALPLPLTLTTAARRPGVALRPYQRAAVDALFAWVQVNEGNPLCVIPTGGGKSLTMGTIIAEALENHPDGRAMILAHRKELIQQNVRAVATVMPLAQIGIYSAGLRRKDTETPILVAGIQSLAQKPYAAGPFDLILIDEAHLVPRSDGTMYQKFIKAAKQLNPHVVFIGLTATPYRLDSGLLHRGDDALFTDIAYEASVAELIRDGYLCPLTSRATSTRLSVEGVGTRGGEFIAGQLERAVDQAEITEAAVAEMVARFEDRQKWLVFCAGVGHAEHVADALRAHGIPAASVHGELDAGTRAERLAAFHEGTLRAVTSMDVLTTGFDEPGIDAIALLRPTKSTGLYVQMVGRGFRLHPQKRDTLVLDFAGNVARHGPVDRIEVRDRESARGEGAGGAPPTKECPACQMIVFAGATRCAGCGHEFPPPPPKIEPKPSVLPILSSEPVEPTWHDVTDVYYSAWEKPEKPTSLRVDYHNGFRRVASEWVCLEHTGYARRKAESWWRARLPGEVPASVAEAIRLADRLPRVVAIATLPDGKFTRVVDARLEVEPGADEAPASPTRSCHGCEHFQTMTMGNDGTWVPFCFHWQDTPPEDFQATGCDHWTEPEGLPF